MRLTLLQPVKLNALLFKGMGNRPATLHDTTSCLRVLAVGFAPSDRIMPAIGASVPK